MSLEGEKHFSQRTGILRAAVLGANDGIISTACLILGVAASDATRDAILVAGMAGLVAGSASARVSCAPPFLVPTMASFPLHV